MNKSWLKDYMSLSLGTEIPDMFALWCGLSGISASLGRSVWLDMGTYKIYPNMFILIVAGSGRCRKSTAIDQLADLVSQMDPRLNMIAQKITPEALIEAMCDGTKGSLKANEGFVCVDELSNFLNKKSYEQGLAALMISLYDCKNTFEYRTKGRGKEELRKTCLGLLGGSTIEWIREAIPIDAIGGGLTSRILFVYVKNPPPPQAWTEKHPDDDSTKRMLVNDLNRMSLAKGPMTLDEEAKEFYIKTYDDFYLNSPFFNNKFLSGYASRRAVHMMKLSMLFSIAESSQMVVTFQHLDQALEILKNAEGNMVEVLSLITATDAGSKVDAVLEYIKKKGTVSRSDLQRHFQRQYPFRELDEIIKTIILSRQVTLKTTGQQALFHYAKGR